MKAEEYLATMSSKEIREKSTIELMNEYAKIEIIKAYNQAEKDGLSSDSKYAFRDGADYYEQEF